MQQVTTMLVAGSMPVAGRRCANSSCKIRRSIGVGIANCRQQTAAGTAVGLLSSWSLACRRSFAFWSRLNAECGNLLMSAANYRLTVRRCRPRRHANLGGLHRIHLLRKKKGDRGKIERLHSLAAVRIIRIKSDARTLTFVKAQRK
jgi:hypothetical protein